ncbi:N-acetylmuramoyl-L-alanine amidase [Clostridiales bacterium]|nr:N-acetylmuramoyl-L-alanine amidase [Clostridiales bacterium]
MPLPGSGQAKNQEIFRILPFQQKNEEENMNLSNERKLQFTAIILAAFALIAAVAITLAIQPQETYAHEKALAFQSVEQIRYAKKTVWLLKTADQAADKTIQVKKSRKLQITGVSKNGWSQVTHQGKLYYVETRHLSKDNGYLVVIDAGHQKKGNSKTEPIGPGAKQKKAKVASGATGNHTRIPEYKLTLKMAKKLEKELKARGYQVKMVRTKHNVNMSNSQRAELANHAGADVFIRIHANSSASSSVSGALTISPTKNNKYCKKIYKKCNSLSKCVLAEFCKATGAKNRGVMYTDTMSGINWSKVPVTIMEMGFLSNKKEDKKMNKSAAYQKRMTKGMANGIDKYLKRD